MLFVAVAFLAAGAFFVAAVLVAVFLAAGAFLAAAVLVAVAFLAAGAFFAAAGLVSVFSFFGPASFTGPEGPMTAARSVTFGEQSEVNPTATMWRVAMSRSVEE